MMSKIKTGILFCGGCNSYFDRETVYVLLKEKYGYCCEFSLYQFGKNEQFEIMVLINGCSSECLMCESYPGKLLVINNLNHEKAEEQFENLMINRSEYHLKVD